jgi:hypothetical protein
VNKATGIEGGIVDSQIRLCKRSVDSCRRRNIAGQDIPKSIMNAMSNLSILVYNWINDDDDSKADIE